MKKLLLTGLLAALAVPATMSAMDDALTLTFNVTGTSVSNGITVTAEGVSGVTATLNSIKMGDTDLSLAQIVDNNISYPNYLCPANDGGKGNAGTMSTADNPQTFNFTISGLPTGYKIDNINLTTVACNANAGIQGQMDRYFQTDALINGSQFIDFGVINIAQGTDKGKKSTFVEATSPYTVTNGSIELTIFTYSTSVIGCFFGLESITFNYEPPVPDYNIEDVVGTYKGLYYDLDMDDNFVQHPLSDVVLSKGSSDTSLVISNLIPEGDIKATYNPFENQITINQGWIDYYNYLYIWDDNNYKYVNSVTITIDDSGFITFPGGYALEVYNEDNDESTEYYNIMLVGKDAKEYDNYNAFVGSFYGNCSGYVGGSSVWNDLLLLTGITFEPGNSNNSLIITNLFPSLPEKSVMGYYNPYLNVVAIPAQYMDDENYFWPYDEKYVDSINLGLSKGQITISGGKNANLYVYNVDTNKMVDQLYYLTLQPGFEYEGIVYSILSNNSGSNNVTTATSTGDGFYAPNQNLSGDVVIPSTVKYNGKDYTVTAIGQYSFANSPMTSLSIPATVTKIDYAAFYNCTDLQSVTNLAPTPQSLTEYTYAFYQVPCETDVLFVPESAVEAYRKSNVWKDFGRIRAIGQDANTPMAGDYFLDNGIYYRIIDATANTVMTKEGSYYSQEGYWEGQNVEGESLEIPEKVYYQGEAFTVVEIGEGSFAYSNEGYGLQSIILPNSIQAIGEGAFSENYDVVTVSLGNGLKSIGADAFYSADSLEEVSITAVVPPVADADAFFETDVTVVALKVPFGSGEKYAEAAVWKDFNIQVNVKVSFSETEHMIQSVTLDEVEMTNWASGFTATTGQVLEITFETYPEGFEPKVIVNNKNVSDEVIDGVLAIVVGYDNISFSATWVEEGTTGINSIESVDGIEAIYNLNGVRVSKDRLTKGLYIINGQKVLVK